MKKSGKHNPISLIVTVLNEAESIQALLDSILRQKLLPAEVIVVDGGSTDATVQVIQQFQSSGQGVQIHLYEKKGNRSIGRNTAIAHAKHELIAITDAGCELDAAWLSELHDCYKTSQKPIIAGYYAPASASCFEAAAACYALVTPNNINTHEFLPATRSLLLTKTVWKQLGQFDESLSWNEDYAFARAAQKNKIGMAFCRTAIVNWHPPRNMRAFSRMIYNFAYGDAWAGLWRSKIVLIFLRYAVGLFMFSQGWVGAIGVVLLAYIAWSINKNKQYAGCGWLWLPLLQVSSDILVMTGTLHGCVARLLYQASIARKRN